MIRQAQFSSLLRKSVTVLLMRIINHVENRCVHQNENDHFHLWAPRMVFIFMIPQFMLDNADNKAMKIATITPIFDHIYYTFYPIKSMRLLIV